MRLMGFICKELVVCISHPSGQSFLMAFTVLKFTESTVFLCNHSSDDGEIALTSLCVECLKRTLQSHQV